jgi:hypothetical protein
VVHFTDNQDQFIPQIGVPPDAQADIVAFLGALTDPRVAAETYPFDRPKLFSERTPANPLVSGAGVAGSGGRVPRIVAITPPNIGNDQFQIGVDNGLVGASATLAVSSSPPVLGEVAQDQVFGPITLSGSGAGDGNGSFLIPLDDDPLLLGQQRYYQWRVDDPGAALGVALSDVAHATIVGLPVPPDPNLVTLIADDDVMQVDKSAFKLDWKRHAQGAAADTLTLRASLNPLGAVDAAGGVVTFALGGTVLFTSVATASNGRAKGVTGSGVAYSVRFDAHKGDVTAVVKGLDLRSATGLSDDAGAGVVPIRITARVDGVGLVHPVAGADLEFGHSTKSGKFTKGAFRYAKSRSLSGVFAAETVQAKCTDTGVHALRWSGVLTGADGAPVVPTGPIKLMIGDTASVVAPIGEFAVSAKRVRIAKAGFVDGLAKFDYRSDKGTLRFTTTALPGMGLPATGAVFAELPARIEFATADGNVAFETTIGLSRKSPAAAKWDRR